MSSTVNRAFTLIELLVVIAIIALLAAILFPVFATAREKGRQAACASNTKQISMAMLMYVQDFDETFPPANVLPQSPHGAWFWPDLIFPYVKTSEAFSCPDLQGSLNHVGQLYDPVNIGDRLDYGMNASLNSTAACAFSQCAEPISALHYPTELLMLADDQGDGHVGQNIGFNGSVGSAGFGNCGWPELWYSLTDLTPGGTSWVGPDARHNARSIVAYCDGHVSTLDYNHIYFQPSGVVAANFRLWHFDAN